MESDNSNRYYYINPWLGGAFNVFEAADDFQEGGCDTTLMDPAYINGFVNPVVIDSSCLVDGPQCKLQDGTALGASQPNICKARQGQNPKYPEPVPRGSLHNTCMQRPSLLPATCTHKQGMLHGLQGDPVGNLYTPVQMSKILGADVDPGGLYSNPLFLGNDNMDPITASYGRMYMDKGEIAGHHIVYGVTADEELVVRAVPLQHHPDDSGSKPIVFDVSNWVNNINPNIQLKPWLPTLWESIAIDQVTHTPLWVLVRQSIMSF